MNPYHGSWEWKRVCARRYSLRGVLAFALMKHLSDHYEIPLPLSRRICAVVCGDFTPAHVGYTIIEEVWRDESAEAPQNATLCVSFLTLRRDGMTEPSAASMPGEGSIGMEPPLAAIWP